MTTSFQLQSHKVVSYQHFISCIKTLSVGFLALCLLLQNGSIGRKVQTSELDIVDETVAFDAFKEEVKKKITKCYGMVMDIFHHDTLQRVSNSPPPGVSFAISKEDKRRLIYWHLLSKMLVYSKGRKTLSCTDILRLAKNQLVINSVNYVFDVPWIIADSTFCIVFKVHQGHPTSIFGKYLFVRRFEI